MASIVTPLLKLHGREIIFKCPDCGRTIVPTRVLDSIEGTCSNKQCNTTITIADNNYKTLMDRLEYAAKFVPEGTAVVFSLVNPPDDTWSRLYKGYVIKWSKADNFYMSYQDTSGKWHTYSSHYYDAVLNFIDRRL